MTDRLLTLLEQQTADTIDPELKLQRQDYIEFRKAHGWHGLEGEVRDYILLGLARQQRQREQRYAEEARRLKLERDST
jgi:hypothetical protein